jgi:hypothetical protein
MLHARQTPAGRPLLVPLWPFIGGIDRIAKLHHGAVSAMKPRGDGTPVRLCVRSQHFCARGQAACVRFDRALIACHRTDQGRRMAYPMQ